VSWWKAKVDKNIAFTTRLGQNMQNIGQTIKLGRLIHFEHFAANMENFFTFAFLFKIRRGA
jgi:hypothetical protein